MNTKYYLAVDIGASSGRHIRTWRTAKLFWKRYIVFQMA